MSQVFKINIEDNIIPSETIEMLLQDMFRKQGEDAVRLHIPYANQPLIKVEELNLESELAQKKGENKKLRGLLFKFWTDNYPIEDKSREMFDLWLKQKLEGK